MSASFSTASMQSCISITRLQLAIGLLAMFLPTFTLILPFFQEVSCWQPSISHSYYTNHRDLFTTTSSFIGISMIMYVTKDDVKHKRKTNLEHFLAVIIGIMSLLIVIFPCAPVNFDLNKVFQCPECFNLIKLNNDLIQYTFFQKNIKINGIMHNVCACVMFTCLAIFIFKFFPNSNYPKQQNLKFKILAWLIFLGMVICFMGQFNHTLYFFFNSIGEYVAVYAFGLSWIIKSRQRTSTTNE